MIAGSRLRLLFAAAALVPAFAGSVFAQTDTTQRPANERPPRALFGPDSPDPQSKPKSGQTLDLSLSLAQGFDDDALADIRPSGITPDVTQTFLSYTTAMPAIDYAWRGDRLSVRGTALSALRYYPEFDKVASLSHTAGLGLSAALFEDTTLEINQTAAFSPSYLFGLFPQIPPRDRPGDALPAAPELSVRDEDSYFYGTTATLSHAFGGASRVTAKGELRHIDFLHESSVRRDDSSGGFGAEFSHRMTRGTSLTTGYSRRAGYFSHGGGTENSEHEIEFGIDYIRPLAVTRRALISVRVGGSTIDVPASDVAAVTDETAEGRLYRLSGNATLQYQFYQFGRPWEVSLNYRRALEVIAYLTQPVFVDGVHAAVEGLFTRRFDVRASGSYSNGKSVLDLSSPTFKTYTGDARIRYSVNRSVAVFGEYVYYFYDFRGNTGLAPGVPTRLERNAVHVGLMFYVPVLGR